MYPTRLRIGVVQMAILGSSFSREALSIWSIFSAFPREMFTEPNDDVSVTFSSFSVVLPTSRLFPPIRVRQSRVPQTWQ